MAIPMRMNLFEETTIKLPLLEELERWSFETSLQQSTNKMSVNESIVEIVKADALAYCDKLLYDPSIGEYIYRVKSSDSIISKNHRHPTLRFQSLFNDILGIRIHCKDYPIKIPDYYRVVDLRKGKAQDDGYRAMHLYYKKSNFHYIIEVQLWADSDFEFNSWTHASTYKYTDPEISRKLRKLYDDGIIISESDFRRELARYER